MLSYDCGPFSFSLTCEDEAVRRWAARVFSGFGPGGEVVDLAFRIGHDTASAPHARWWLTLDGRRLTQGRDRSDPVEHLLWQMNQQFARRSLPHGPVLHAAAVARNGRAVVLPASANAGKSTLCAALVTAGWEYLTDEAVTVSASTLEARPFHKSVALDPGSWPVLPSLRPPDADVVPRQWQVEPDRLGRRTSSSRISHIIFPQYDPAGDGLLTRLSRADALVRLMQTRLAASEDDRDFRVLVSLVRQAECFSMRQSGIARACAMIDEVTAPASSPAA